MSEKIIESLDFEKTRLEEDSFFFQEEKSSYRNPLKNVVHHESDEEKIEKIAYHFEAILDTLGLDLSHDSIQKTPKRVAKMFVNEIFSGLKPSNFPKLTFMKDTYYAKDTDRQMIFTSASFISFCEHHFLPIDGKAYIAYLPNQKLIGLSKIPRLVQFFAKRPQVQERLTAQIQAALSSLLETEDVAVCIQARHYCVIARGVQDQDNQMSTHVLKGLFDQDHRKRNEFFEHVNRAFLNT